MNKGYKAFLIGTATDLPTRGYYLKEPTSKDNGKPAAGVISGVFNGAAILKGR
jgi:hypothetical protein